MRVTILVAGTRGDVQPFIALGTGLRHAGHSVRIATHRTFESLVHAHGLEFFPIAADPRSMMQAEQGRQWLETGQNPVTYARGLSKMTRPFLYQVLNEYWEASQGADLVIGHGISGLAASCIAEKKGIAACSAYIVPVAHPTREFPQPVLRPLPVAWPAARHLYNRTTYKVTSLAVWQMVRQSFNRWRRDVLGLSTWSFWPPYGGNVVNPLVLYAFSEHIVARPADWPSHIRPAGSWFLDHPVDWQPPADLVDFLAAGPPPVFVGFGSMSDRSPQATTEIVLSALEKTGQRGIVLTGWGGMTEARLPDNVKAINEVPLDWLFPRMAAVVHHAGAGTTATGLRAGVPSIAVPFFSDQFFWARRITELGVCPKPIPRRHLSSERLADAINQAVTDLAMRERAQELGKKIRTENGVARAVAELERFVATRSQSTAPITGTVPILTS